jgi:hypothetical protein
VDRISFGHHNHVLEAVLFQRLLELLLRVDVTAVSGGNCDEEVEEALSLRLLPLMPEVWANAGAARMTTDVMIGRAGKRMFYSPS